MTWIRIIFYVINETMFDHGPHTCEFYSVLFKDKFKFIKNLSISSFIPSLYAQSKFILTSTLKKKLKKC